MAETTQPKTFQDLYIDLQNRVRSATSQTSEVTIAKRFINSALEEMHIGTREKLPYAQRSAKLITQPKYSTGTISIAKGSTSLTGTGTAWATSNEFGVPNVRTTGKIVINGGTDIYDVASIASDTSLTLDARFVGENVTDGTYEYFEDTYDLASDFLRPYTFEFFDQAESIKIIDRRKFQLLYPRSRVTGQVSKATVIDEAFEGDASRVRRVRLFRPPDQAYLIPYTYITRNLAVTANGIEQESLINEDDEPIVPLQYRLAIVYLALANWFRDRRDDSRRSDAKAAYLEIAQKISADFEVGAPRAQLQPNQTIYRRSARSPYRRRGRRHTTGTTFDEIRE